MITDKTVLINEYVKALRTRSASIFLGAGMSYDIFNLDWKSLLAPYAKKIGISLDDCSDYAFVAQAYVNRTNKNDEFHNDISQFFISNQTTEFHRMISKFPIQNYWTTNYDRLLENAFIERRKHMDVIFDNDSFTTVDDSRDSILYKCHGDCLHSQSIIITKADYEEYCKKSYNFVNALHKEFAINTVLFLGYSFRDPDINNICANLKVNNSLLKKHFLIMVAEKDSSKALDQQLWIEDKERYGIFTLLIDKYNDVYSIVKEIEKQYMSYKVLISGSATDYSEYGTEQEAKHLIYRLGYELVKFDMGHGLKIVNGNGLNIGSSLYEGIAEAAAEEELDMADYLMLYPFPKTYYSQFEKEVKIEEKYKKYREKMIAQSGVVFFMFGNKREAAGKIVNADGVRKEFDIAVTQGKYVFPIGATGYMSSELAQEVCSNYERYNGADMPNVKSKYFEMCKKDVDETKIIENIKYIIDALSMNTMRR